MALQRPHGQTACEVCGGGTAQPESGQAACVACAADLPLTTADGTACFGIVFFWINER